MNNWPQPNAAQGATAWPNAQPLKAKEHCCEEAAMQSTVSYIPCNAPAVSVVGWKGHNDNPIRMCAFCADHNVRNRGGYIVEPYTGQTGASQAWPSNPTPSNPWDAMNEDALLLLWQQKKDAIETAKAEEMDLRRYIVKREFPKPTEGTNTKALGEEGWQLKAVVKYNYNLADNDTVEATLDKLSKLGNAGSAISDRLVSWKPHFLLTEFRQLQEDKEKGSKFADDALKIIYEMITITDAAPTMTIVEPKAKKK